MAAAFALGYARREQQSKVTGARFPDDQHVVANLMTTRSYDYMANADTSRKKLIIAAGMATYMLQGLIVTRSHLLAACSCSAAAASCWVIRTSRLRKACAAAEAQFITQRAA
jgi:hypothetical protein